MNIEYINLLILKFIEVYYIMIKKKKEKRL